MSKHLVNLPEICQPKQWPTISKTKMLLSGYPVFGANGRIGYFSEYNHAEPTILITCRGATCGAINVCAPKSYVTGNAMSLDNLEKSRVDFRYLVHALKDADFSKVITGVAQPQITRQSLSRLQIPLPPLDEQQRIAEILDAADALRAKRRESLAQIDALLQSTFLHLFGDGNKNPKSWPLISIGDLAIEMRGGASLKPNDFTPSGFPILHKGAIKPQGVVELDTEKKTYASTEYAASKPKSIISRDFVAVTLRDLVPAGPSIGLAANLKRNERSEYMLAQGAYGFRFDEGQLHPDYFVALSNEIGFRTVLKRFSVGSTQIHIRTPIYQMIKIPLPPIELQRRFATIVESVEKQKTRLRTHLAELDALFSSLQSRAFNGEL